MEGVSAVKISSVKIEGPTVGLRFIRKVTDGDQVHVLLQQRWVLVEDNKTRYEWRDVPLEEENEK
jgi:hypothetical protein